MTLDITDAERELLNELFEEKQRDFIREINHTDTIDFKRMLKEKLELLEGLMRKLSEAT